MEHEKKTYYVDLNSESILTDPLDSSSFVIRATEKEVSVLRKVFEEKDSNDWDTFIRSHIPYLEYHHDPENDRYDESQKVIYAILHLLGDEEAKRHIEGMGVLTERKEDDPKEIEHFK